MGFPEQIIVTSLQLMPYASWRNRRNLGVLTNTNFFHRDLAIWQQCSDSARDFSNTRFQEISSIHDSATWFSNAIWQQSDLASNAIWAEMQFFTMQQTRDFTVSLFAKKKNNNKNPLQLIPYESIVFFIFHWINYPKVSFIYILQSNTNIHLTQLNSFKLLPTTKLILI